MHCGRADVIDIIDVVLGGCRRLGRNVGMFWATPPVCVARVLLADGLILRKEASVLSFRGITITAGSRGEAARLGGDGKACAEHGRPPGERHRGSSLKS